MIKQWILQFQEIWGSPIWWADFNFSHSHAAWSIEWWRRFSTLSNSPGTRVGQVNRILSSRTSQVWPLTKFFLLAFCRKLLICLEGKSMTPRWGNTLVIHSYQQLPRLWLGPLMGFLSCMRPTMALDLPRALLPELQRIKDAITLGTQVPGPCKK